MKRNKKYKIRRGSIIDRIFNPELLMNKFWAIILILCGAATLPFSDGDCTGFMFTLMLGLPVFFCKDNCIDL